MNAKIQELMEHAKEYASQNATGDWEVGPSYQDIFNKKFAELIVRECVNTLEFHGFDDAVPYINWMAANKLGVKE